jgi:hypothetical protein
LIVSILIYHNEVLIIYFRLYQCVRFKVIMKALPHTLTPSHILFVNVNYSAKFQLIVRWYLSYKTLQPRTTLLIRPELRCTETVKYYYIAPIRRSNPSYKTTFSLQKGWHIRGGVLYRLITHHVAFMQGLITLESEKNVFVWITIHPWYYNYFCNP